MAGSPWTAPVPYAPTDRFDIATFGTWNGPDDAVTQTIHPVEVQVSDVGVLARTGPFDTRPEAFPTPGSLLLPLRVANRSMADYVPPLTPAGTTFPTLAFTTELHGSDAYTVLGFDATGVALPAPMQLQRKDQIDNGRAPIFDVGFNPGGAAGDFAAHHIPPQVESPQPAGFDVNNPSTWPGPGGLRTNPWGQLIFDYFTTLPLSSPGPYVCPSGDPSCPPIVDAADAASLARLAGAKPRVDQDGLRVQGRVNLNSAPWKALAGVPFVPMDRIPVAFRATVKGALNLTDALGGPLADNAAGALGDRRAQAIVAYREAGDIGYFDPVSGTWVTTGDYGDSPVPGNPNIYRGRGWKNAAPQTRRGTGFMSVGELANVRNALASGWQFWMIGQPATAVSPPLIDTLPEAPDNNSENFIAAAAPLIALNEWVSVRSHVFTVYGVFRGEANPDLDQSTMSPADVQKDINSRAIRFQETIDRLPTFLGQPLPQRIGDRAAGPYMDYRN
jgi:hypothetical protein